MSICIRSIHATALGPIDEFFEDLSGITLIYGKNEVGKTYLVEFILKALFKNTKGFVFRDSNTKGKIEIDGLGGKALTFSEHSKKKIEDLLDTQEGFPPNLANLIVVKGAEVKLDKTTDVGLSAEFVRQLLSGKSTLDIVLNKIQKTVRDATYEGGIIEGASRGKVADLTNLENRIQQLDSLINKINNEVSFGELQELLEKKKLVLEELGEYAKAKRHKAYQLSERISELRSLVRGYIDKDLDGLSENVESYFRVRELLKTHKDALTERSKNNHLYEWLDKAIPELTNLINKYGSETNLSGIYIGSAILAVGVILVIGIYAMGFVLPNTPLFLMVALQVLSLMVLTIGGALLTILSRKATKSSAKVGIGKEIEDIKEIFRQKFGMTEADIATMEKELEKYRESYYLSKKLLEDVRNDETEIETLEVAIREGFKKLQLDLPNAEKWRGAVNRLEEERNEANSEIGKLGGTLEGLEIRPDEYLESSAKVEYDPDKYNFAKKQSEELIDLYNGLDSKFDGLKNEVVGALGIGTHGNFVDLLDHLKLERLKVGQEYKNLKSDLIAKILMTSIIERSNREEVEKIKSILSTELVSQPLKRITKRYENIEYSDGEFYVTDNFDRYRLSDLSTGATEQVFTALRIGLASHFFGKRSGFMIFDDAFQHSDWDRRPNLIWQLVEQNQAGWQIIYFSMDNHIKELFESIVKNEAKANYSLIELG
jgi:hypothetical protein